MNINDQYEAFDIEISLNKQNACDIFDPFLSTNEKCED